MENVLETEFLIQTTEIKGRLKEAEEPLINILKDAAEIIREYSYHSELEGKLKQFEVALKELHSEYLMKREKIVELDASKKVLNNSIYKLADIRGPFLNNSYENKKIEFLTNPSLEEKQLPLPIQLVKVLSKAKLLEEDRQFLKAMPKELVNFVERLGLSSQILKIYKENDTIRITSSKGSGKYNDLKIVNLV